VAAGAAKQISAHCSKCPVTGSRWAWARAPRAQRKGTSDGARRVCRYENRGTAKTRRAGVASRSRHRAATVIGDGLEVTLVTARSASGVGEGKGNKRAPRRRRLETAECVACRRGWAADSRCWGGRCSARPAGAALADTVGGAGRWTPILGEGGNRFRIRPRPVVPRGGPGPHGDQLAETTKSPGTCKPNVTGGQTAPARRGHRS